MTITYRTDSDQVVHQVWTQRQAASCAVASIWMARNQARQMTVNETEWELAWSLFREVVQGMPLALKGSAPAPMTFHPGMHEGNQETFGNMFSRHGTYMHQVATKLANEGLTVRHLPILSPGTVIDASMLSDAAPAIVLLGWYNGSKRTGGHFIVASRVTRSGTVVYLDPWGGQLREMGVGPRYQGNGLFEEIIYVSRAGTG